MDEIDANVLALAHHIGDAEGKMGAGHHIGQLVGPERRQFKKKRGATSWNVTPASGRTRQALIMPVAPDSRLMTRVNWWSIW